MAKQQKTQQYCLKLHSSFLAKYNWDLKLPIEEARQAPGVVISLADSQILTWINELNGTENYDSIAKTIRKIIKELKNKKINEEKIKELYRDLYKKIVKKSDAKSEEDYVSKMTGKSIKEQIPKKSQKEEEKAPKKQDNSSTKKEKKPLTIKEPSSKELNTSTDPSKAIIPCKAKIENFPSRNELLQILSNFIEKNQLDDKCCRTSNGDNIITVSFKNSNICFDFVKELNILKLTNSLYSKIRTNIVFDFKTPRVERKPKNTISLENSNVNSVNSIKRKGKVYTSYVPSF